MDDEGERQKRENRKFPADAPKRQQAEDSNARKGRNGDESILDAIRYKADRSRNHIERGREVVEYVIDRHIRPSADTEIQIHDLPSISVLFLDWTQRSPACGLQPARPSVSSKTDLLIAPT